MHPLAPVVALDIDGTTGRYHEHFRRFAAQWTGRELTLDWSNAQGHFHRALGMTKTEYRQCKLAYRQGGLKRSMPVYDGASEMTKRLRRNGIQVWICTTRPYQRLDSIDPDTQHMLKRQGIKYDGLLYGEHKYRDLVKIVGKDRVLLVIDDLPEQITEAHRLGLRTCLMVRGHNEYWEDNAPDFTTTSLDLAALQAIQIKKGR